jgi:hypothetical protein
LPDATQTSPALSAKSQNGLKICSDLDPALIDDQAFAVSRFITGVMGDFVRNDETTYDVAHLDSMIQAILEGIRDSCQRATRA